MAENLIGRALDLAIERHRGQVDKAGKPYLGHLLCVAARVSDEGDAILVAVLHDILEDTPTTPAELLDFGFPPEIVDAVVVLTKDPESSYMENIAHVKTNRLAKKVKIADLMDNLDPSRRLPDSENWMVERYQKALAFLEDKEIEDGR